MAANERGGTVDALMEAESSNSQGDPDKKEEVDENGASKTDDPNVPYPSKKEGSFSCFTTILYRSRTALALTLQQAIDLTHLFRRQRPVVQGSRVFFDLRNGSETWNR